jgi:hypothetical protein
MGHKLVSRVSPCTGHGTAAAGVEHPDHGGVGTMCLGAGALDLLLSPFECQKRGKPTRASLGGGGAGVVTSVEEEKMAEVCFLLDVLLASCSGAEMRRMCHGPSIMSRILVRLLLLMHTSAKSARRREKIVRLLDRLLVSRVARAELERVRREETAVSNLASTRYVKEELLWAYRSKGPPKPISVPAKPTLTPAGTLSRGEEGCGQGAGGGAGGGREDGGFKDSGDGEHAGGGGGGDGMGRISGGDAHVGREYGDEVQVRRRKTFRVSAAEESILDSSLATLGAAEPLELLRGGGCTVELANPPLPPGGPGVVSCGRVVVQLVEDDSAVMSRWYSLVAQALPPGANDAGSQGEGGKERDINGRHASGDEVSHEALAARSRHLGNHARFFGRLLAMSLLWDECHGSCLAHACWHHLWTGLHQAALQDAWVIESRLEAAAAAAEEARNTAGKVRAGEGAGGISCESAESVAAARGAASGAASGARSETGALPVDMRIAEVRTPPPPFPLLQVHSTPPLYKSALDAHWRGLSIWVLAFACGLTHDAKCAGVCWAGGASACALACLAESVRAPSGRALGLVEIGSCVLVCGRGLKTAFIIAILHWNLPPSHLLTLSLSPCGPRLDST